MLDWIRANTLPLLALVLVFLLAPLLYWAAQTRPLARKGAHVNTGTTDVTNISHGNYHLDRCTELAYRTKDGGTCMILLCRRGVTTLYCIRNAP